MFELTIKDQVYQFNFGMGFMREINKKMSTPVDGVPDVRQNVGLRYMIATAMFDKDLEALVELLVAANKGFNPRVTPTLIDAYIDDENTDIDGLFKDVSDFLRNANATKTVMNNLVAEYEKRMNAQKGQN